MNSVAMVSFVMLLLLWKTENSGPIGTSFQPRVHTSISSSQLLGNKAEEEEEIIDDDDDIISSSPDSAVSNTSLVPQADNSKSTTLDGSLTQKMQIPVLPQEPPSNSLKISDVITRNTNDPGSRSKHVMEGQKIITLDTATEIEGWSTGCKVYANIGEDTYDIVIPVKDDPDGGEAKLDNELPKTSGSEPPNKRMKVKHDDHYELIVDGRVYYICIVCKRSYVCLTSLRRHFNIHSCFILTIMPAFLLLR